MQQIIKNNIHNKNNKNNNNNNNNNNNKDGIIPNQIICTP